MTEMAGAAEYQDDIAVVKERIHEVENSSMQGNLHGGSGSGETAAKKRLPSGIDSERQSESVFMSSFQEGGPRPVPSVVSMKSEPSRNRPVHLAGDYTETGVHLEKSDSSDSDSPGSQLDESVLPEDSVSVHGDGRRSAVPSVMSMKSDQSINLLVSFAGDRTSWERGSLLCSVCPGSAYKSCLTCVASFCETHVRHHYTAPALQRHKLVDTTGDLEQRLCQQHHRELEFYCRNDQTPVCAMCVARQHSGHEITEQGDNESLQLNKSQGASQIAHPPPGPIKFISIKPDSVSLTWGVPEGLSGPQKYKVTWRCEGDQDSVEVSNIRFTAAELTPGKKYEFAVATLMNDDSQSPCVFATASTEIPKPDNVTIISDVTSLSVTWSKPAGVDEVKYLLSLHSDGECLETLSLKSLHRGFDELLIGKEYSIRVSSVLKKGGQSDPVIKNIRTKVPAPEQLSVDSVTTTTAHLCWSVSHVMGQTPHSFLISYHVKGTEPSTEPQIISSDSCSTVITGLKPATEYIVNVCVKNQHGGQSQLSEMTFRTDHMATDQIRATAVGKLSSDVCSAVALTAVGPPTELRVVIVKANSITLTWSPPSVQHCESVKQYIIEFREESSTQWQTKDTGKEEYSYTLNNLKANTLYSVRMRTDAGVGVSVPGKELQIKTKKGPLDKTKFTLLSGDPPVYLLKTTGVGKLNKKVFGSAPATKVSNKTIMVVGATGSGKTTLINGMINYILGVEWEDNYRFKLIDEETSKSQACSQISEVTAYQIYHSDEFQVKYSLTIIDTPGFGDTRGIKQDQEITEKIREFFSVKGGVDCIDAVCFVVQSVLARLTHTQKYIFDAILSIFGKNIATNIIPLVTFADGKSPPVLVAIKDSNIPTAKNEDESILHFKFNNSVLFAKNTGANNDDNEFDHMFWKLGKANMNKFFTHLNTMNPQSLTLTKEVLEERRRLEATVEGLQPMIKKGLATLREIDTTKDALQNHETHMKQNKDFEYEVDIPTFEQINIDRGTFITNCHGCNYTCHYPCHIPKDADKSGCAAMSKDNCTVCPGKCHWSKHVNMTYRYETKIVKEKRTYGDLKSKFETALGQKMSTENIMKQLEGEYEQVKNETVEIMETVTKCLRRLSEISLRPDPLSTPDYIDLLIESEKQEGKHGFMERIKQLQEVRKVAVFRQRRRSRDSLLNFK